MNQDTCCQFVSVVWLKDTLRPDATSILSLAKEDKEKKHAYSAFCSAIFPFCSPNSRTPASWRWNGWKARTEAPNHNSSLEHPLEPVRPCKSLHSFSLKSERGAQKWRQRSTWLHLVKIWPKVSKLQISSAWQNEGTELIIVWFVQMCKHFYAKAMKVKHMNVQYRNTPN